jgi:hypothetical protein
MQDMMSCTYHTDLVKRIEEIHSKLDKMNQEQIRFTVQTLENLINFNNLSISF